MLVCLHRLSGAAEFVSSFLLMRKLSAKRFTTLNLLSKFVHEHGEPAIIINLLVQTPKTICDATKSIRNIMLN